MDSVTALLFVAGLGALIAGAELLVHGASRIAAAAGISPVAVGLRVVALGTSTPELVFDIPVMIAVALACLPVFVTGVARTRGCSPCTAHRSRMEP